MKKVLLSLVVCLGLSVAANASDLKAGDMVVKNYDNYRINPGTGKCEKQNSVFKDRLLTDIGTGLVKVKNVYQSDAGTMTYLVAEDNTGTFQIFVSDTYGECEFGKGIMTKKISADEVSKYVGLKDPNER